MAQYIKMNDTVKVLTGKDKGKEGKVIQLLPSDQMVIVEGANKMFKHLRSQKQGEKGQRVEFAAPMKLSKVMLICPKCKKMTRAGIKMSGKKKQRVCKKCNEVID